MATLADGTRSTAHQRPAGLRYSATTGLATARHPAASQPPQPNAGIVLIGPVGGARG